MAPAGTQETICRIVEEYSDMLLRLACTRLGSTQDAEDGRAGGLSVAAHLQTRVPGRRT